MLHHHSTDIYNHLCRYNHVHMFPPYPNFIALSEQSSIMWNMSQWKTTSTSFIITWSFMSLLDNHQLKKKIHVSHYVYMYIYTYIYIYIFCIYLHTYTYKYICLNIINIYIDIKSMYVCVYYIYIYKFNKSRER